MKQLDVLETLLAKKGRYSVFLDFYGVRARLESDNRGIIDSMEFHFRYFVADEAADHEITIRIFHEKIDYSVLPYAEASSHAPHSFSYDLRQYRIVDYFGRALAIYNYDTDTGAIFFADSEFEDETTYLLVMSRVGEFLDRKKIHRIHALGVSCKGSGVVCVLPQGGGKTTLALDLLKERDIQLLSEDTPLINKKLKLLPFPIRMGIRMEDVKRSGIGTGHLKEFRRAYHPDKYVLDLTASREKISRPCSARVLIVGKRVLGDKSIIVPVNKARLFMPLLKTVVFGLGLPQVVEYFLRGNPVCVMKNIRIASLRLMLAVKLLLRCDTYIFFLGQDTGKNARTLKKACRRLTRKASS
ncbi:MAG: hypothetical protein ABH879_09725 [archaeon]